MLAQIKLPFTANAIRNLGNFYFLNIKKQWVDGKNIKEIIEYVKKLRKNKNSTVIINNLGEHYIEKAIVDASAEEYKNLLDAMGKEDTNAALSIKPSQFGGNCKNCGKSAEAYCFKKIKKIVELAKKRNIFVWMDMENSQITQFTIDSYKSLLADYSELGLVLQANLKRTRKDLRDFIALTKQGLSPKIRLVKGVYTEPSEIAYQTEEEKHSEFKRLIEIAFKESPKNFGVAIASHHNERVQEALNLQEQYQKDFFEIQVLKGVRQDFADSLRARGLNIVEYVPYGNDAFAYSIRRAMRDPKLKNSLFLKPFYDVYKKYYV